MLKVAVASVEFRPISDFEDFAGHMRGVLDRTPDADIVVLPEYLTLLLLTLESGWHDMTMADIPIVSKYTAMYREFFTQEARKRGQYILAGTHLVESGTQWLNTAHFFWPDGRIDTHAKTHLFRAEGALGSIAEGVDAPTLIELPKGRVAMAICYEVQIPEVVDAAVAAGAELLLVPSFTLSEAGSFRVTRCARRER